MKNLTSISNQMKKNARKVELELIKKMEELGKTLINTDNSVDIYDSIFAYYYNEEDRGITEKEIKAIKICQDKEDKYLVLLLDNPNVIYTDRIIENADENKWYALFGSDILGVFTSFNIAEYIDEYI